MNVSWWSGKRADDIFITQKVLVVGPYVAVSLGSGIASGDLWEDARQQIEKHGWTWTCEDEGYTVAGLSRRPEAAPPDDESKATEPLKLEVTVTSVSGSEEGAKTHDTAGGYNPHERCVTYDITSEDPNARRRAVLALRFLLKEDPHWKIGQKIKLTIEAESGRPR